MAERPESVLLVEDEALIRLATAQTLESSGYKVFLASDADEAIRLLEVHGEIRLVLTDVHMPGSMDGVRLAHYVRGKWPPIKLMVISGVPSSLLSPLPLGAVFMNKPLQEDALVNSVRDLLTE